MRKKGAILAVIAGLYALTAAVITLIVVGGVGPAAKIRDLGIWLAWGAAISSFATIVLGAMCRISRSRRPALLLVFNTLFGAALAVTPVSIFLILAFIGGLLALLGGASKPPPPGSRLQAMLFLLRERKRLPGGQQTSIIEPSLSF